MLGAALTLLHIWSRQDPSFCFDPLLNRRVTLSFLEDCGFLHSGRVVQGLTAWLALCVDKLRDTG